MAITEMLALGSGIVLMALCALGNSTLRQRPRLDPVSVRAHHPSLRRVSEPV
jgi:hypothetical protein